MLHPPETMATTAVIGTYYPGAGQRRMAGGVIMEEDTAPDRKGES